MNLVAAPRRHDVRADCTEEVKATGGTIAETGARIRSRLGRSKLPLQEAFRAAVSCPPASVSANSSRNSFRHDRRESGD